MDGSDHTVRPGHDRWPRVRDREASLRRTMAEAPATNVTLDEIVALCKRRGFVFPASEIYGGIASTYDYGHYGVLLKRNVKDAWWQAMIGDRTDVLALDSASTTDPKR